MKPKWANILHHLNMMTTLYLSSDREAAVEQYGGDNPPVFVTFVFAPTMEADDVVKIDIISNIQKDQLFDVFPALQQAMDNLNPEGKTKQ